MNKKSFIVISGNEILQAFDTLTKAEEAIHTDRFVYSIIYIMEMVAIFKRKTHYDSIPLDGETVEKTA